MILIKHNSIDNHSDQLLNIYSSKSKFPLFLHIVLILIPIRIETNADPRHTD
jgi:hypothetical protein